jgi:hypothetical protein
VEDGDIRKREDAAAAYHRLIEERTPPVRNAGNLARYRRDIEKATGKPLPSDEDNFTTIGKFFGSDLDYLDRLGVLNRGYCPFCGVEPIDQAHYRTNKFGNAKLYLCRGCWEQTNPDAQLRRSIISLDLTNPNHRRALPYYLMALAFRNIAKVLALVVVAVVLFFVLRK